MSGKDNLDSAGKILAEAQQLYNDGKWLESDRVLIGWFAGLTVATDEQMAQANRLQGWSRYYVATKNLGDKKENLTGAENSFRAVRKYTTDKEVLISVFGGLPLVLWLLDKKGEAWIESDEGIDSFPDEPSVWNARVILCRWEKDFAASIRSCEMVFKKAFVRQDYRTAGHGKQNKADALKELGRLAEAENEYVAAVGLYTMFEKASGKSAEFHIKGVLDKLEKIRK
jgi:hypothetical protein